MSSCQAGRKLSGGDSILAELPAEPNTVLRVQLGGPLRQLGRGSEYRKHSEESYVPKEKGKLKIPLVHMHKCINKCTYEK